MTVELAPNNPYGLQLSSPVLIAAGCIGYATEPAHAGMLRHVGALISPTTRLHGQRHPPPQIREVPAGILYSGAWPERSLRNVLEQCAPLWASRPQPTLVSLAAGDRDAATIAGQLEGVEGVGGIELDCSAAPERAVATAAAIRRTTLLPILAKLPADAGAIAGLSEPLAGAGADALVVAAPPHARWGAGAADAIGGRLCGPCWAPIALQLVALAAASSALPVIGAGGISSLSDARQMLAAGARAVQIGSALLGDPLLASRIGEALSAP